ncbi:hypothetical protein ACH4VR_11635 [Streptomyces sp. NPDC020883]|uniref:hypothetical protein n=1 Tax=Streptomyces sp. NPDC020883 TaxID=3365099 RepID=UPI0037A0AF25
MPAHPTAPLRTARPHRAAVRNRYRSRAPGVGAFHQARTPPGPQRLVVASRSWTHTTPDAKEAAHAGEVGRGPHRFSRWTHGERLNALGHASDLWVATTNDLGRRDVYINADHLSRNAPHDPPPCM